jgi:hypothetical protein
MGAHATSLARCGRGGEDDGVAADDESTENVDERSAWLLPALQLLLQQLAELTLEAAASGQGNGDCRGSSMVLLAALFGGLGGGDDAGAAVAVVDEEAGAAIIYSDVVASCVGSVDLWFVVVFLMEVCAFGFGEGGCRRAARLYS